jgi:hypothetical protein
MCKVFFIHLMIPYVDGKTNHILDAAQQAVEPDGASRRRLTARRWTDVTKIALPSGLTFPVRCMMHLGEWTMLRSTTSRDGMSLIGFIVLAACGTSSPSSVERDAAIPGDGVSTVTETEPTAQTAATLETGVDQAALAAAVIPQVAQFIGATQPGTAVDGIRLGRPWGEFDVHKGPRLVFRGSWRLLAALNDDYFAVVSVAPDGNSYKMVGIGSAQFVPTMVEREQLPAVSAALDRGRAGFLRRITDGGDAFVAYEAEPGADAGPAAIRVQPLGLQVIDGGSFGVADMSLDDLDATLPAE